MRFLGRVAFELFQKIILCELESRRTDCDGKSKPEPVDGIVAFILINTTEKTQETGKAAEFTIAFQLSTKKAFAREYDAHSCFVMQ